METALTKWVSHLPLVECLLSVCSVCSFFTTHETLPHYGCNLHYPAGIPKADQLQLE